jgi:hypothetical protein
LYPAVLAAPQIVRLGGPRTKTVLAAPQIARLGGPRTAQR